MNRLSIKWSTIGALGRRARAKRRQLQHHSPSPHGASAEKTQRRYPPTHSLDACECPQRSQDGEGAHLGALKRASNLLAASANLESAEPVRAAEATQIAANFGELKRTAMSAQRCMLRTVCGAVRVARCAVRGARCALRVALSPTHTSQRRQCACAPQQHYTSNEDEKRRLALLLFPFNQHYKSILLECVTVKLAPEQINRWPRVEEFCAKISDEGKRRRTRARQSFKTLAQTNKWRFKEKVFH